MPSKHPLPLLNERPARSARGLVAYADLTVPINPLEAATVLGIEVAFIPFSSNLLGMLVCGDSPEAGRPSHPVILLNRTLEQQPARMRFTLAHELGHFCLHSPMLHRYWGKQSGSEEREANQFASEFLMPYRELIQVVHRMPLQDLAVHFGVSREAMKIRLRETRLFRLTWGT